MSLTLSKAQHEWSDPKNQNMKALVTGADGFIGSHLVQHLVANNFQCLVSFFCEALMGG